MRILYDFQAFSIQEFGGISRYFTEILKHLKSHSELSIDIACVASSNHYLLESQLLVKNYFGNLTFKGKGKLSEILNRMMLRHRLKKGEYDIFHPTYYYEMYHLSLNKRPFVITIHDMIHEKLLRNEPASDELIENKKILAHKAAHIIAVSETTKSDIVEAYGIREEKISVIYHGSSLNVMDYANTKPPPLDQEFILFVGSRSGYKNFAFLLEAFARLKQSHPRILLFCAGGGAFSADEMQKISLVDCIGRVLQRNASDEEMALLYKHAMCFVFPSKYEGFGIPVLEAFSQGCPVAASNCPALVEVCGDAAAYFDPYSVDSIHQTLCKIIESEQLRYSLSKLGIERGRLFSWDLAASRTLDVYKKVLSEA